MGAAPQLGQAMLIAVVLGARRRGAFRLDVVIGASFVVLRDETPVFFLVMPDSAARFVGAGHDKSRPTHVGAAVGRETNRRRSFRSCF